MKSSIIIGIMALTLLVVGCGKKAPPYRGPTVAQSFRDEFVTQEKKVAESSQVIAYASADTSRMPNIVLTVSEIWKGAPDASALGITNGTQLSINGGGIVGGLPDGAIVFIPVADSPSIALQKRQVTFVRSGRVLDMTVQEFRKRLGL
jgi:hypothetical protein